MSSASRFALLLSILLAAAASGCTGSVSQIAASATAPEVAAPTVEGPITGGEHGFPFIGTVLDLAAHAYVEEEFFVAGTAHAFASNAPLAPDGRWSVAPAGRAPYRTRILVRRPRNSADFNGTVLVEWLNVSGGSMPGRTGPSSTT